MTAAEDLFKPAFANPLEELLADSLIRQTPKKTRRVRNAALDPEEVSDLRHLEAAAIYNNPANWQRTCGVALMHRETNELLGNFSEYIHLRVLNCRKLVREDAPMTVAKTEWVSGKQWIEWADEKLTAETWSETVAAILDIHIPELGVRAFGVELQVTTAHGGIYKVVLADDTHLHSDDKRSAVMLPKGLSILPVLSLDTKLAIRAEVGL